MKKRIRLLVIGRVQGVFFRASILHEAERFHLNGFVRNLADGRVEVVAEGEEADLKRMIDWSRKGPPDAMVEHVDIAWAEATGGFESFQIR